jgi:magnesium transporter
MSVEDDARAAGPDPEDDPHAEDYALKADFVRMIVDAIDGGDSEKLAELLSPLHPADYADLMGFLSADDREEVVAHLAHLEPEELGFILSELDTEIREEVLEQLPADKVAQALGELDSDDAADVVDDLEEDMRAKVLAAMPETERAAIETALAYADETAGRLMQREFLAAPQFWTVGQTIDYIRKAGDELPELFFDIYVVDPANKPVGAVPVSVMLRSKRETPLSQIMEQVNEISVDQDQEEVAYVFDKYHLISAPVVDAGGRLVGQITVDDIVGVIQEESEEDMLAMAGVSDAGRDAGIWEIVGTRLPWLLINTLTAALAASVISYFQGEIAKAITLAVLMPIVASLGGNAGTQTLAVAVRSLAGRELNAANAMRIVLREMTVGVMNGVSLGVVLGGASYLIFQDLKLSATLSLALVINLFLASVAGILVPLTLDKLGRDPAVASSVFVTFVTDFMGFLSILGLAAVILL